VTSVLPSLFIVSVFAAPHRVAIPLALSREGSVEENGVPRLLRPRPICHPDRSGPILPFAPICGASGRVVEGSAFSFFLRSSPRTSA